MFPLCKNSPLLPSVAGGGLPGAVPLDPPRGVQLTPGDRFGVAGYARVGQEAGR